MNLIWQSGGVEQGASDHARSNDYTPTDTQTQVRDETEKDVAAAKPGFAHLPATGPVRGMTMSAAVQAISARMAWITSAPTLGWPGTRGIRESLRWAIRRTIAAERSP